MLQENEETFGLFQLLYTQFRTDGAGHPIGLDFGAIGLAFEIYEIEDRRSVFGKLLIMSDEVYGAGSQSKNQSKR